MECPFKVGDKVVCVEQRQVPYGIVYPKVGTVLTVREIDTCHITGKVGLRLEAWKQPIHPCGKEFLLHPRCFRPVVSRSTDKGMSILRGLLDSKTTGQPVKVTA